MPDTSAIAPKPAPPITANESAYPPLHIVTPLVHAATLSATSGHDIYLKLETQQRSGSFKARGIGRACWSAVQRLGPNAHLVAASGGNAGIAAAISAQTLGVKCTVFVHNRTERTVVDKMREHEANVVVSEGGWEHASIAAHALAEEDPNAQYIHPFEGDAVIRGHTTIVDEIYDQYAGLTTSDVRPDVICCSVGGGGLIRGIMLRSAELAAATSTAPAHILGITTIGADSFGRSLEQEAGFVEIEDANSRAKSLVCKACSPLAVYDARAYGATGSVAGASAQTTGTPGGYFTSARIDDAYAGAAAWQATDELDHLIELSCGAALAPAYQSSILDDIAKRIGRERLSVVLVVCGGSRIDRETVDSFREEYGLGYGRIVVNGRVLKE